jgi:hypothetical protein
MRTVPGIAMVTQARRCSFSQDRCAYHRPSGLVSSEPYALRAVGVLDFCPLSVMADETANHFRRKAAQCRRIARQIPYQNDPVVISLLALAAEFEAKALAVETDGSASG